MDNPEEILQSLEEFSKMKPKDIPRELDDYLCYVAKTGDPVFKWSITKCLFREKLLKVITDFYESTLTIELPPCPNVDPFNYEIMKNSLIEKLDSFHGAPFTVQRISELLTNPRKEYNRADKFMRAIEKNILVVSTREPGKLSDTDSENIQDTPPFNGIPEPNESPLETTFICNDIGVDPDSSSPNYEAIHPGNQGSFSNKVDIESSNFGEPVSNDEVNSEITSQVPNIEADHHSPQKEAIREESVKDKKLENEREISESVICSTVPMSTEVSPEEQINEVEASTPFIEDFRTNVSLNFETNENEESTESLESREVSEFEDIHSNNDVSEDIKRREENIKSEETSCESVLGEATPMPENNETSISSMHSESFAENSNDSDLNLMVNSEDTLIAAECDTSNSCDLDSEVKEEQGLSEQSENLPSSDNEVTSCSVFIKEERITVNDVVLREASVIQVTASSEPGTDSESMEVEECQSSINETEPSLDGAPVESTCSDSSSSQQQLETSEEVDMS